MRITHSLCSQQALDVGGDQAVWRNGSSYPFSVTASTNQAGSRDGTDLSMGKLLHVGFSVNEKDINGVN